MITRSGLSYLLVAGVPGIVWLSNRSLHPVLGSPTAVLILLTMSLCGFVMFVIAQLQWLRMWARFSKSYSHLRNPLFFTHGLPQTRRRFSLARWMNLQSANRVKVPLLMKWVLALVLEANFIAFPWLGSEWSLSSLNFLMTFLMVMAVRRL